MTVVPRRGPATSGPAGMAALAAGLLDGGSRFVEELGTARRQVAAQSRAAADALRSRSPRVQVLVLLWTIGIVGDGLTTVLMMRTGRFEEANGAAAALMGVLGVSGWVVLSALVCVWLASLSLARPRGTYAWTAATVAVLVCVGKVWTTVSNALLWWTAG